MAVPATTTTRDMSGAYTLNKTLSSPTGPMLKMQNVGFLVRQAAAFSNVTITLRQYTDAAAADGVVHLEMDQVSTGGIRNEEHWLLDGVERDAENRIWGKVRGLNRFIKVSDLTDDYLKEGWDQSCIDGGLIETLQGSRTDTWTAQQITGFAEVDGKRRQVRRCLGRKGDQEERVRIVYDWKETQ